MSLDTTLYDNALRFLNLSGKLFGVEIFATWHLIAKIAKIAKISASRKFPAIRYSVALFGSDGYQSIKLLQIMFLAFRSTSTFMILT